MYFLKLSFDDRMYSNRLANHTLIDSIDWELFFPFPSRLVVTSAVMVSTSLMMVLTSLAMLEIHQRRLLHMPCPGSRGAHQIIFSFNIQGVHFHMLPNPTVVWTNESTCNFRCEITKLELQRILGVSEKFPWFLGSIMVSVGSSFQRKIKL